MPTMPDSCSERCRTKKFAHATLCTLTRHAFRFFKGEDWPKNYAVAIEYYKLAAAENYEAAQHRLEQLLASQEYKNTQVPQTRPQPKTWRLWSLFRRGKPTAPSTTSINAGIGV